MYNLKEEEMTDWQELTQLFIPPPTHTHYIELNIAKEADTQYWHGQITVHVGNGYTLQNFIWEV